ncbi:MAG: hypothetical protein GY737_00115 [Desulfobacteraceae bacterium]|nr:hypothetical protein [Desulfobacteraceae bacterium]
MSKDKPTAGALLLALVGAAVVVVVLLVNVLDGHGAPPPGVTQESQIQTLLDTALLQEIRLQGVERRADALLAAARAQGRRIEELEAAVKPILDEALGQ